MYALVAKLASICTILTLAAWQDLELHQVDIKGIYLNGELMDNECIYMCQLPGYGDLTHLKRVHHLCKMLYSLKQSGRWWYQKLIQILVIKLHFKQCTINQAVFVKHGPTTLVIIVVYINDYTIMASSLALVIAFKVELSKHVEIMDLGELCWLLSIEVTHNQEECSLTLSQWLYLDSIIFCFNFDKLKPVSLPIEQNVRLSTSQSPSTGTDYAAMQHVPYQEAVRLLMYAALGTWPNISYAVTNVLHFSSNPDTPQWDTIHLIYYYLLRMKDLHLTYGGVEKALVSYIDTDWSMDKDHKAISGYTFLINGDTVLWSSKKQEIMSLSTTESKYVTMTHTTKEALWLHSLITKVFHPLKVLSHFSLTSNQPLCSW